MRSLFQKTLQQSFVAVSFLVISACLPRDYNAKQDSLSGKSATGKGRDRVYLATLATTDLINKGPEVVGNDMLFVVGCTGEPEDETTLIKVASSPIGHLTAAANSVVQMPLNKRTKLHEFIGAPNQFNCEILVGDETKRTLIEIDTKKYSGGDYGKLRDTIVGSTASCLGITAAALVLTSAYMPAAKKIVANDKAAVAKGLVGFRDGSKISKDNFGSKLIGIFSGVAFCGSGVKSVFEKMKDYQEDESLKIFFEYMQSCTDAAEKKLNTNLDDQEKYLAYKTAGRIREAAAVFNPYFVREFNEIQHGQYKQKAVNSEEPTNEFFEAVRSIETRIDDSAYVPPAADAVPDSSRGSETHSNEFR